MTGLVLEGGGARGAYQIGAYYAMKECGLEFDGFCGNSIGAFNSAMLACGKEKELLEFWENVDIPNVLGLDETLIKKIQNREIDVDFFGKTFKSAVQILKNRGIEIKGLEKVLKEQIDEKELRASKKDFGLCTIKLNGMKPLYIFKEEMKEGLLHEYILASCYLPCFHMEKKVDGNYYTDGCFYDNSPVNMLIGKGYTKLYVVRINPFFAINIKQKPKKKVDITYIKPSRNTGLPLEFRKEKTLDNISMGYYDTLRILKGYDGYKFTFQKKKDWYYKFITRKASKQELKRVKNFFRVKTKKEAVIKSLEYIMEKEHIDYYAIYKVPKMIRYLKKNTEKKHFIYDFVGDLKFL